jgi:hypothetical protein
MGSVGDIGVLILGVLVFGFWFLVFGLWSLLPAGLSTTSLGLVTRH